MNDSGGVPVSNVASDRSTVGVQAQTVHIGQFFAPKDDSPGSRFDAGLRALRAGAGAAARELMRPAVLDGFRTPRTCFYLMLALLKGRTRWQVPPDDLRLLQWAPTFLDDAVDDDWSRAVRVIDAFLRAVLDDAGFDFEVTRREFESLGTRQSADIIQHLDIFMAGPRRDWSWLAAFKVSRAGRYDNGREERAWRFFQPEPIGPRVRKVRPVRFTALDRATVRVATTVCGAFGTFLIVQAWRDEGIIVLGPLLVITIATLLWFEARLRVLRARRRLHEHDQRLAGCAPYEASDRYRFASSIDKQFTRYFRRYAPRGVDRDEWLAATVGIRRTLRDEVVEIYREQSVKADRVAWLTRFLVRQVRKDWQTGAFRRQRAALRVPSLTRVTAAGSAVVAASGSALLTWNAVQETPRSAVALTATLACGLLAVRGWTRLLLERARVEDETRAADRAHADRLAEFRRWKAVLSQRPSDAEMATWLDCDRKALAEETLRHYRIDPQDVVAHAFIDAPARSYRRARKEDGPWRYTRYDLHLFFLSRDGLRQVTATLDFRKGLFLDRSRTNYRYDAVAALRVVEDSDGRTALDLSLIDSQVVEIEMVGRSPDAPEETDEADRHAREMTLDAAGLDRTLHVLEGIAAEGRQWFVRDLRREQAGFLTPERVSPSPA